jgi:D-serine deaminase-like pyridoxal phosphate-dependent protein
MPMSHPYTLADSSEIYSPALLFYKDLIRANIARAVEMAGGPERLRPHVKTHKTREIVRMEQEAGITRHKCATLAEAEMLADCGVADVLLAYPMVGPNCGRLARLARAYPGTRFGILVDHPEPLAALSQALVKEDTEVDGWLDVDVGQHRTGLPPGPEAVALYEQIHQAPGVHVGGLHVYDGHNHQSSVEEREAAVLALMETVKQFRATLAGKGLPVPRLVLGGTPTFPIYARLKIPGGECSPGTCFLHDHGYGSRFQDLAGFTPAAVLLTRVISRPTPTRITLDLGTKALASDPPAGKRCLLLDVPEYQPLVHNEEHFVVETPHAARFRPGDEVYAIPTHICPTCALHQKAHVIEGGKCTETWAIVARDRVLTW